MRKRTSVLRGGRPAVMLPLLLAGCAMLMAAQVKETEQMLSAAGFRMKPADTPDKLAQLQTLKQHKILRHVKDGKVIFLYADAKVNRCLYVGDEAAYQEYQKLALQKKIADEQRWAAEMNEDAAMRWDAWGPWGPGWGPGW